MKLIAINGSPRRNANTATLLKHALEGAASQEGVETELINLYGLNYKGCTSCFACKLKKGVHGKCAMKDDLSPVLEKIIAADAVIFGSPIYLMNLTSGMNALLERLIFSGMIYSDEIPSVYPHKIRSGFIYTMNITEEIAERIHLKEIINMHLVFAETVLGHKPETLYAYNTYQFNDYSKYESSKFSEIEKGTHRLEIFPMDCDDAFEMGKLLAK
ncbi:MAG: flavodoxin family protein [Deferribacteraceae bacterium]|jgi:multimeric flavodoxin WrbA|nr:flavodoxin family protein [Deferribacteraceae bacterium]